MHLIPKELSHNQLSHIMEISGPWILSAEETRAEDILLGDVASGMEQEVEADPGRIEKDQTYYFADIIFLVSSF